MLHLLQLQCQPAVRAAKQLGGGPVNQLLQFAAEDPATRLVGRAHQPRLAEGDHAAGHALEDRLLVVLGGLQIAIALAQLAGHAVERQGEVVDLIDGAALQPLIQLTFGHRIGGAGQLLQW